MYTEYEYVIVHKSLVTEINRFGQRWRTQTLQFRFPESREIFSLSIANKYDISELKKGDKVKLNLRFFQCGNGVQQIRFCVNGLLLCS
ncbi:hypothetical protein [Enterococcus sp. BWR-S5]|uniref:hypothetical protein n=1 Tax=Enterococcus sp. BWR-S5 TaxID=2787714 RepID=UPI001920B274|nr:hypothetical protein [Enterococcus sp. BWR-S5]MBL1224583.1 hypothetical protein [Enterococcus sp. BWR-S5]MBL1224594.1 hypothetical protein [Enterococcus sp. BWR-S5]